MVAFFLGVGELLRARGSSVTEVQEADFAFGSQDVCRRCSYRRNSSEVRRVLPVCVLNVHPQTNSELDSWWLAHGAIHHRHMTNPTMDFSGTPDNDVD